jgi:hypothetical protein
MNSYKPRIIYERSKIMPIPQSSPTNKKEDFSVNEYSLKKNFFDPSKSSPPNEFMLKLKLRMSLYESLIKEDKRISE